jgi:pre-mRNA-splicing factor CWC22
MLPVGKAGGAYIPPFRLKQMQAEMQNKSSPEYQRMTWEALKKTINGLVNKVTRPNISGLPLPASAGAVVAWEICWPIPPRAR